MRIVVEKNDPVGDLTTDVLSVKETSNDQGERVVSFKVLDAPTFGGEVRAGGLRVKAKEGDVVISETGINAGGNKITNVGKGDIDSDSTDAVNGTQLYDLGESVAQSLGTSQVEGGGSKFDKKTGKVSFKVDFAELDSQTTVVSACLCQKEPLADLEARWRTPHIHPLAKSAAPISGVRCPYACLAMRTLYHIPYPRRHCARVHLTLEILPRGGDVVQ